MGNCMCDFRPVRPQIDSGQAHERSESVTGFEHEMLITRSCAGSAEGCVAIEERRAYGQWLEQEQKRCRSEEEFTASISRTTWTQLAPVPSCSANGTSSSLAEGSSSCMSAAEKCKIQVTNKQFFQELIKKQPSCARTQRADANYFRFDEMFFKTSGFFVDVGDRLVVGKQIAEGGQAKIYEGHYVQSKWRHVGLAKRNVDFVLKVFPLEQSEGFRHGWAKQSESICMQYNELREDDTCCFVHNCTLLKDARFAFLMSKYWGDLRKAINVRILRDKTHLRPPFPPSRSTIMMYQIARGMRSLHGRGILHKDLKADNVLIHDNDGFLSDNRVLHLYFYCHVADFESTEGVMGTGFWRAPEVLAILRSSSKEKYSDPTVWTEKVDVYSFGMTCYEILSGCIPFRTRAPTDYNIGDERPALPDYVDREIQELVRKCWDSEPSKRPTFEIIVHELEKFLVRTDDPSLLIRRKEGELLEYLFSNHD